MGGTGAPGAGSLIKEVTDSPLLGAKAAMQTSFDTFGSFPASVMTAPPYECPTKRPFRLTDDLGRVAATSPARLRVGLGDAHVLVRLLEDPVDALPSGAIDKAAVDENYGGSHVRTHDIRQVIAAARFEQKNADIGIFR